MEHVVTLVTVATVMGIIAATLWFSAQAVIHRKRPGRKFWLANCPKRYACISPAWVPWPGSTSTLAPKDSERSKR